MTDINETVWWERIVEAGSSFKIESEQYLISQWHLYLYLVGIYLLLNGLLYLLVAGHFEKGFLEVKRVLLVTAHPDDETMFFGPTLLRLVPTSEVFLLCLSSGNYYGQGDNRKSELWESCKTLGVKSSNVTLCKYDLLPDDPRVDWDPQVVADAILRHLETLDIDILISFDQLGVSSHKNHKAIFQGLSLLKKSHLFPDTCQVYTLSTVNIVRKYLAFFDLLFSYLYSVHIFTCSLDKHAVLHEAMAKHSSQYVWYRRIFMYASRYTYINTYTRFFKM